MAVSIIAARVIAHEVIDEVGVDKARSLLRRLAKVTANESYQTSIARVQEQIEQVAKEVKFG